MSHQPKRIAAEYPRKQKPSVNKQDGEKWCCVFIKQEMKHLQEITLESKNDGSYFYIGTEVIFH